MSTEHAREEVRSVLGSDEIRNVAPRVVPRSGDRTSRRRGLHREGGWRKGEALLHTDR